MFEHRLAKNLIYTTGIIIFGLILGVYLQIALAAWNVPISIPADNNVSEPISAGANAQLKSGALGVGGIFETDTDTYFATTTGKIGIGTNAPQKKLTLNGGNFLQIATSPKILSKLTSDNFGSNISIAGKYAYITGDFPAGDTFSVVDISNPLNPVLISTITDNNKLANAGDIAIAGKYAYVAVSNFFNINRETLTLIDISNKKNPLIVASYKEVSAPSPNAIYVSGKYAYLAMSGGSVIGRLEIIDISNPQNPTYVNHLDDATYMNTPTSIYVSGKYAYIIGYSSDSLAVVDISDPMNLVLYGKIFTEFSGPRSIYVTDGYAYIASSDSDSVSVVNVSDPTNMQLVGNKSDSTYLNLAENIYVAGQYAYVTGSQPDYFTIVDISDRTNPEIAGSVYDTGSNSLGQIAFSGKYAYTTGNSPARMVVIDISGIDAPTASIGSISASNIEVTDNMNVGNNLYIGNGLNVGPGGIKSDGPIQATSTETLGFIKFRATTTSMICNSETEGSFYYNQASNNHCYCNGSDWTPVINGGTCQ